MDKDIQPLWKKYISHGETPNPKKAFIAGFKARENHDVGSQAKRIANRDTFEAWNMENDRFSYVINSKGEYTNTDLQSRWIGWQACLEKTTDVGKSASSGLLGWRKDVELICDLCGGKEKKPFDIGDECICGGKFLLGNDGPGEEDGPWADGWKERSKATT